MRIKAGTLAVDITADGKSFETTLKRSDSLSEAFSDNVDRRMKRAGGAFKSLGQAVGATDQEMAALEKRMRDGLAADAASRALENLRRYAGLTTREYRELAAQMGVATRETDKSTSSMAALAKQAALAAAAYLSFRAAVGVVSSSFADFREYESALTDMAKVTDQSLSDIDAAIKAMPRELGDPTSLVKGYYQTISAGVTDATAAMDLLTTAAKGSKAAHVAQDETIKGLTKTMAGFDGEIRTAAEASDLLFKIEKMGQTSFSELVPVIGDVAESTHLVGVSSQEMAAGLSLITQTSGSTAEAATKWRAIMIGLYKPTENMQKVLKALGYESGVAMVKEKGFAGALQTLQATADKSHFSLGKLFESAEALTGIAGLGAQDWQRYTDILTEVEKGTGETEAAFQRFQSTSQGAWDTFGATWKEVAIDFGEVLAPMMTQAMKDFQDEIARPGGRAALTSLATGAVTLGENLLHSVVPGLTATVNGLNDIIAVWNKLPAPLQGAIVGGGTGALLSKGNPWVTGVGALYGMATAGDAANDRSVAEGLARAQASNKLYASHDTSAAGPLPATIPSDFVPKAQKAAKAVDGIKVSLDGTKKSSDAAANAAARYTERSDAYFEQVQNTVASLTDSLSGGLESETLKVDKTFEKIFTDIRKSLIGAKGDTEGFAKAWELAEKAWPVAHMTAVLKDFEKGLEKSSQYARDMGTYLSDPAQLEASDWLEGYKKYIADLREARIGTDEEDAEAIAKAEARWDAYQAYVLKSQRDRLQEGGQLSDQYWEDEAQALENHLAAVKQNASSEYAYRVYASKKRSELRKKEIEARIGFEESFLDTLKDVLADEFGLWEDDLTRKQAAWVEFSKDIASGITDVEAELSDALAGATTDFLFATDRYADQWSDTMGNLEDMFKNTLKRLAQYALENYIVIPVLTEIVGSDATSSITGSKSSGSSWLKDLVSGTKDISGLSDLFSFGSSSASLASESLSAGITVAGETAPWATETALTSLVGDSVPALNTSIIGLEGATEGVSTAIGAGSSGLIGSLGSLASGIGAVAGLVGLGISLFSSSHTEEKTGSGYSLGVRGTSLSSSGEDYYRVTDSSMLGGTSTSHEIRNTGPLDASTTAALEDAFGAYTDSLVSSFDSLGINADLSGFSFPDWDVTEEQLDDFNYNVTNAMTLYGLQQQGLADAVNALADEGEYAIDTVTRLGTALASVKSVADMAGLSLESMAGEEYISGLVDKMTSAGSSASLAGMDFDSLSGVLDDETIASLQDLEDQAGAASDGVQATSEQLRQLALAAYASDLVDAFGSTDAVTDAFNRYFNNAYSSTEQATRLMQYYAEGAGEALAALDDSGVSLENFWSSYRAAMENSALSADQVKAWDDAAQWVEAWDSSLKSAGTAWEDVNKTVVDGLNDQIDALNDQADAIQDTIDLWDGFRADIQALRRDIKWDESLTDLSPKELLDAKKAAFDETAAKARTGDTKAQADLDDVTKEYLNAAEDYYGHSEAYYDQFDHADSTLSSLEAYSQTQVDQAQAQLDALNQEISVLTLQVDQLTLVNTNLGTLASAWGDGVNAIVGAINDSSFSSAYADAIAAANAAQASAAATLLATLSGGSSSAETATDAAIDWTSLFGTTSTEETSQSDDGTLSIKRYAGGGDPLAGEVAWVGERGPELVRFGANAHVYNAMDTIQGIRNATAAPALDASGIEMRLDAQRRQQEAGHAELTGVIAKQGKAIDALARQTSRLARRLAS